MSRITDEIQGELKTLSDPKRAELLQKYFKTDPGHYGEGDVFLGLTVPQVRLLAKKHHSLKLEDTLILLKSKFHESRLLALIILTEIFKKSEPTQKKKIFSFYLKNRKYVNNWDLVDSSAPTIVGGYLLDKNRKKLYELAKSKNLWDRRISVLATFFFIGENDFEDTLEIAQRLLNDPEDLIHKAAGWALREVGKRDINRLRGFLRANAPNMPRTMLRYAIEKLDAKERQRFMRLKASRI